MLFGHKLRLIMLYLQLTINVHVFNISQLTSRLPWTGSDRRSSSAERPCPFHVEDSKFQQVPRSKWTNLHRQVSPSFQSPIKRSIIALDKRVQKILLQNNGKSRWSSKMHICKIFFTFLTSSRNRSDQNKTTISNLLK